MGFALKNLKIVMGLDHARLRATDGNALGDLQHNKHPLYSHAY